MERLNDAQTVGKKTTEQYTQEAHSTINTITQLLNSNAAHLVHDKLLQDINTKLSDVEMFVRLAQSQVLDPAKPDPRDAAVVMLTHPNHGDVYFVTYTDAGRPVFGKDKAQARSFASSQEATQHIKWINPLTKGTPYQSLQNVYTITSPSPLSTEI